MYRSVKIPEGIEYHCIVCDIHLPMDPDCRDTAFAPGVERGSVAVGTTGNWGSQVWDCCGDPGMMYFAVCDRCIIQKAKNIIIDEQGVYNPDGSFTQQPIVRQGDEHYKEWKKYLEESLGKGYPEEDEYRLKMLGYYK